PAIRPPVGARRTGRAGGETGIRGLISVTYRFSAAQSSAYVPIFRLVPVFRLTSSPAWSSPATASAPPEGPAERRHEAPAGGGAGGTDGAGPGGAGGRGAGGGPIGRDGPRRFGGLGTERDGSVQPVGPAAVAGTVGRGPDARGTAARGPVRRPAARGRRDG